MIKLCDINPAGEGKSLPPRVLRDKSNIGVHYVDAFITPMNATLTDPAAHARFLQAPRSWRTDAARRHEKGRRA